MMEWTMRQKKDIVSGRHSFCLSYPAEWQEQPQRSNISAVLQISRYLRDENCYQPIRLGRIMAVLIHAANSLPVCKRAILCPNFPMTRVEANCCNLANTSSLLANADLRKIFEWPICHSASDKLSLFDNTCTRCSILLQFLCLCWKKNVELLVKASVIFLVRVTLLGYPDLQQAAPTCLD